MSTQALVSMMRLFAICVVLASVSNVLAWSPSPQKAFRSSQSSPSPVRAGLSPNKKTSQKPNLTPQNMLRNSANLPTRDSAKKSSSKLSNSVLADCDTLPSFPTAHGLLSPETVMRLEDLRAQGHGSEALVTFLDQYRKKGPLSCLPMLSDPDILPHLTQAMRELAA